MSSFTERAVNIPESIQDADFLGAGLSAWVYQLDAVAKCYSENDFDYRGREIAVYKRLTAPDTECPDTIVRFYGVLDGRVLLLQFARHGSIRQYYANPHPDTPLHTRLRWAEQITGAIIFLHSRGVFHGDLSCNNVFLDEGLNAKLGDFASSSIEGSPFEPLYEDGHFLPDESADPVTHEIFALGSVFYEIMTGSRPYDSITAIGSHEIKNLFSQGRFPDLEQVPARVAGHQTRA
ncbi:hypothetical protein XA68_17221 [Ophiocordyceps unilateralis]|uniref:EKC/KEOPS complex subunit BUD32 n=1 Tax=Ophiocordyceps unilateralis TaxID=268505 RepID=A0A2A9P4U4_OPHUN|nr:hypothetical protein XA68_17221 [Ophiocordyceps unilateralis]